MAKIVSVFLRWKLNGLTLIRYHVSFNDTSQFSFIVLRYTDYYRYCVFPKFDVIIITNTSISIISSMQKVNSSNSFSSDWYANGMLFEL